jgi:hypothetical protein
MENKITYLDVLNDTISYYSEDTSRRSISGSGNNCLYNGPNGKQCAFARCAKQISTKHEGKSAAHIIRILPNILKDEYAHLTDKDFWQNLQNLHDDSECWDGNGLSVHGKRYTEDLRRRYE